MEPSLCGYVSLSQISKMDTQILRPRTIDTVDVLLLLTLAVISFLTYSGILGSFFTSEDTTDLNPNEPYSIIQGRGPGIHRVSYEPHLHCRCDTILPTDCCTFI
jgi:hypothetical protein